MEILKCGTYDITSSDVEIVVKDLTRILGEPVSITYRDTTEYGDKKCPTCDGGRSESPLWGTVSIDIDPCCHHAVMTVSGDVVLERVTDTTRAVAGVKFTRLSFERVFVNGEIVYPEYNTPTEEQAESLQGYITEFGDFEKVFYNLTKETRMYHCYEGYCVLTAEFDGYHCHALRTVSSGCNGGSVHVDNLKSWLEALGATVSVKYLPK